MDSDELKRRTKLFAHRCVKLAQSLPKDLLGKHAEGQLIRCATSVACNYRAVCLAQSRASFAAKVSIVLEEVDESHFWLEFIKDEGLLESGRVDPILKEAGELSAIFAASRKTVYHKR